MPKYRVAADFKLYPIRYLFAVCAVHVTNSFMALRIVRFDCNNSGNDVNPLVFDLQLGSLRAVFRRWFYVGALTAMAVLKPIRIKSSRFRFHDAHRLGCRRDWRLRRGVRPVTPFQNDHAALGDDLDTQVQTYAVALGVFTGRQPCV